MNEVLQGSSKSGFSHFIRSRVFPNLKWVIYTLLFINLAYYGYEDWANAQHTLTDNPTLMEKLSAYATTLDDIAWIFLIGLFEIETYWLEDDFDNKWIGGLMIGAKVLCYGFILQTTFSYLVAFGNISNIPMVSNITDLCSLAGQELSFVRNLAYDTVNAQTCETIPYADALYLYPHEPVVTDTAGLALENRFGRIDIMENISWLIIIVMIEFNIQVQNRGHYDSSAIKWSKRLEYAAYLAIILAAIHWFVYGHIVYAWDEFVWIAGFAMLDNNLSLWREELEEADNLAKTQTQ